MSERDTGELLTSLRRAATLHRLYGVNHPLTTVALADAARSADALAGGEPVQLTVMDESVYLDRTLLPMASLTHGGFLRTMQDRGVKSVTLVPPVDQRHLASLISVIAGDAAEAAGGASVRLNEDNLAAESLSEPPARQALR